MAPHPAFKGLGQSQLTLLVELDCRGDRWSVIPELSKTLGMKRNHLRAIARSLIRRGLLEVRKDPTQQMVNAYRCTALGHEACFGGDREAM